MSSFNGLGMGLGNILNCQMQLPDQSVLKTLKEKRVWRDGP